MYGFFRYDNVWPRYNYLKICNLGAKEGAKKNLNIDQITFVLMVVQIKFLAMHITNNFF